MPTSPSMSVRRVGVGSPARRTSVLASARVILGFAMRRTWSRFLAALLLWVGCGGGGGGGPGNDAGSGDSAPPGDGTIESDSFVPPAAQRAELWYSVDDLLVRIEISPDDGSVVAFHTSQVIGGLELGQNAITMLADGSLLGAR